MIWRNDFGCLDIVGKRGLCLNLGRVRIATAIRGMFKNETRLKMARFATEGPGTFLVEASHRRIFPVILNHQLFKHSESDYETSEFCHDTVVLAFIISL